jgi:hypothetical protein
MRLLSVFFVLCFVFAAVDAKGVKKTLRPSNFKREGPFIFLTKFHIGAGYGQMDMTYT